MIRKIFVSLIVAVTALLAGLFIGWGFRRTAEWQEQIAACGAKKMDADEFGRCRPRSGAGDPGQTRPAASRESDGAERAPRPESR